MMVNPKIRFPEFTDTLKRAPLSEFLYENIERNKALYYSKKDVLSVSGEYGVVNQIAFHGKSFAGKSVADYHIVETGDIVYTKSPLKESPYGIIKSNKGKPGIVSTLYAVYHPRDNTVSDFVQYYFENNLRLNKFLKPLVNIGAKHDMKINNNVVLTGLVCFPCKEEQQKIVDFFSTIDDIIESTQKEVDSWKEMKCGIVCKLFTQKLRFKANDGVEFPEWENIKFGDLIQEYNERTTEENEDVLLSAAIEGMFLNSELFDHQRGASNKGYKKVKYGTMILSTQNLHLGNANVNTRFEHGIVSPAYKTYNIVDCSADFMAQWVKTEYAKKFFYDATTAGASLCRRNVEWDVLYNQKLSIPCLEEQQKIADCLSDFDSVIEKTTQKLEIFKRLKKGLMQRMFV